MLHNQCAAYILIAVYKIPRYITPRGTCVWCEVLFNGLSPYPKRYSRETWWCDWPWPVMAITPAFQFCCKTVFQEIDSKPSKNRHCVDLLRESYAKYILVLTGCQSRPCRLAIREFILFIADSWLAAWKLQCSKRMCQKTNVTKIHKDKRCIGTTYYRDGFGED